MGFVRLRRETDEMRGESTQGFYASCGARGGGCAGASAVTVRLGAAVAGFLPPEIGTHCSPRKAAAK